MVASSTAGLWGEQCRKTGLESLRLGQGVGGAPGMVLYTVESTKVFGSNFVASVQAACGQVGNYCPSHISCVTVGIQVSLWGARNVWFKISWIKNCPPVVPVSKATVFTATLFYSGSGLTCGPCYFWMSKLTDTRVSQQRNDNMTYYEQSKGYTRRTEAHQAPGWG